MKKLLLMAVVAIFSLTSCSTYNNMVTMEESVKSAWSNVETQYQRRADLIPNLVSTVKGYASHEESTLTAVIDARSKATSINISMDELTPEKLAEYQKAQSAVTSALGRLIAVSENYPDLKANQNSWSCRHSWRVQRIVSPLLARHLTMQQMPITCR